MQKLHGTLRRKNTRGPFYYRLTVANGVRKEFALKTTDELEALQRAEELDSIWTAQTMDVAVAQINAMKGFSRQAQMLPLSEGWAKYEIHPERATPHTVSEQLSYKTTYEDFVAFVTTPGKHHTVITTVAELNSKIAEEYASFLKSQAQAVDTHNRKIKRLRKIFDCLKDYYSGENPFRSKTLLRNAREEQDTIVRRQLKDCVLLQWQNVDMERRRIWVKQFKTGKEVTIPMAAELYAVLEEAQTWKEDQYVCPKSAARYNKVDRNGKSVGVNLINIDVLRVIRWIGLEPSVAVPGRSKKMTVYGFHSLRHAFASFCAEAGVPKAVLLSILGTDSEIADKYYTHVGDAAQQQAIDAVSGTMNGKSDRDKINEVLALLAAEPEPSLELLQKIRSILQDNL